MVSSAKEPVVQALILSPDNNDGRVKVVISAFHFTKVGQSY
jgi:hypothetical protein